MLNYAYLLSNFFFLFFFLI
uniref:Uncharacterized protein n=1 Tax=Rhizophora mucronata TaxID=61149 RepID=A0A2P2L4X9_RHIMU